MNKMKLSQYGVQINWSKVEDTCRAIRYRIGEERNPVSESIYLDLTRIG